MIGYHLAYDGNLIGMVMTQGRQREVINIGMGIRQMTPPLGPSIPAWVESQYHKVSFNDHPIFSLMRHTKPCD